MNPIGFDMIEAVGTDKCQLAKASGGPGGGRRSVLLHATLRSVPHGP